MTDDLVAHALVVHLFAPATGTGAEAAHQELTRIWRVGGVTWDITAEVEGTGLPADPPSWQDQGHRPFRRGVRALAAGRSRGPGMRQAMWLRNHDTTCLSLGLTAAPGDGWRTLSAEWATIEAGADLAAMLGHVRVYTAEAPDPWAGRIQTAAASEVGLARTLNATTTTTAAGIWLGDLADDEETRARTLLALAPAGGDSDLSALVWTHGPPTMAPLTRYLLHAARLRYQAHVLRADSRIDELHDHVETTLARLVSLFGARAERRYAALDQADTTLTALQAREHGLLDASFGVVTMLRTVEIAEANLRSYSTAIAGPSGAPGLLFRTDADLAEALRYELDDTAAYLSASRARAEHFAAAAARAIQRLRDEREQRSRWRQERFVLLQTAIIGTVLMCLTAIQSLSYRVPLPNPARPALIAALGGLALVLSSRALRLSRDSRSRTWPSWFELSSIGAFAACVAWLAVSWSTAVLAGPGRAASEAVTVAATLAAAAFAVTWRIWRRRHAGGCDVRGERPDH